MTKRLNPLKALEELLETYNTREDKIQADKFRVGEEVTNLVLIFREGKFRSPRKIRGIIVERQMSVRYSTGYLVSGVNYVESREVCVSRRGSTVECCNGRFSPSPWRINQERSEGRGSGTWPSGWSRAARPCAASNDATPWNISSRSRCTLLPTLVFFDSKSRGFLRNEIRGMRSRFFSFLFF